MYNIYIHMFQRSDLNIGPDGPLRFRNVKTSDPKLAGGRLSVEKGGANRTVAPSERARWSNVPCKHRHGVPVPKQALLRHCLVSMP